MTKKRILILLITLFTIVSVSYSQTLSEQEQAVEDKAFKNLSQQNYGKAGELFSQLLSIYRKSPVYNYYYGVCLVEQNKDIDLALKYIKYAEQNNLPQEDAIELDYYLGRVYHLTYDFETALMYYKDFYDAMGEDAVKLYDIDREIRMAENGKELIQYISDLVVIENKKINKENYYYSYKLDDYGGKLIVKPDEYKTKLDKKNTHTQLMFLSDSGVVMYSSYGKKSKTLDIYQKKKDENGVWSEPEILPDIINTKYDDAFPYLHTDGLTLYFASKGHNSMGGYDIFKSVFDTSNSQWTKPVNMDFPTNTPYDDYLYISDNNDEYAYFASNRETAGDNITIYKILIDKNPEKRQIEDLQEIKTKSLLQVSPLAVINETKTNNSEYINNQTKTNDNTNSENQVSYNYNRLSISDILTNDEAIRVANEDAKKQKEAVEKTKTNADNVLLYSYSKHKEADELYKSANDLLSQNNLSVTDKQRAEKMQKEAKQNEEEAILAYNVYRNLTNDISQKQTESEKTSEILSTIENSTSVEESVNIINKNRERNQAEKQKYFDINKEKLTRKEKLVEIKSKKEKIEPNIINIKKDIDENNQQISILTKEGNSNKVDNLKQRNKTLIKQYKEELNKKEKLVFEEQKLENEINYLSNIEQFSSEIGKTELIEKLKEINAEELLTKLDEKGLQIDAQNKTEINNKVEKQTKLVVEAMETASKTEKIADNTTKTEVVNDNTTINDSIETQDNDDITENTKTLTNTTENNKTETVIVNKTTNTEVPTLIVTKKISESDYKTSEGKFIVEEINDNLDVVDSLNYTIAVKKQELAKETNPDKKKKIEKEISDLETFVEIKTNKNEQLLAKASQIETSNTNNISEKDIAENTKTETNTTTVENSDNNNLVDLTVKNNEINALYNRLNKNVIIVDSLDALSKEKQLLADKTEDVNEKEILINESEDLSRLASVLKNENKKIKTQLTEKETEVKTIALNSNIDFKEEKQFPFENNNSSDKVLEYNKELFKQKFYQQKVKELKEKKSAFEQTKKAVKTTTAKQEIDNQIILLDEKIKANASLSLVSKIKSEEIAKTITNEINTQISDEELYSQASSYEIKNASTLSPKEKQSVEFVKDDKEYANESYKNYKQLKAELDNLNSKLKTSEGKEKADLEKEIEIKNQEINTQFNAYKNTMTEANYVEFDNLENLISKHSHNKSEKTQEEANKLQNEAKAYYIQANIIRTNTEKDNKNEIEKAINYENIAINKQKQALDIYLSDRVEETNQLADNSNSLTLSLDEEEAIKKSNQLTYKSESKYVEIEKQLNNVEKQLEKEKNAYGKQNDKNIAKLEATKMSLLKSKVSSLKKYNQADSIKYNLYYTKINELNTSNEINEENKIRAVQYINESDYFYSNAQILKTEAETTTDIEKKINKLEKAKQLEQTAIKNQEIAFNLMLNKTDDIFTSYGNLVKIDPLISANKTVSTDDVRKATSRRIYNSIKLNEEDIQTLNEIPEKEEQLTKVEKEIAKLELEKEELNKSIILTDDAKTKAKYQKKIQKTEEKIFALEFTKLVEYESLNDSKYYVLKDNLSKNKLRGESEKARQGNQLSKNANKYYSRAKTLRNKSEMAETADKAYALLLEANELELEGIDAMERAYTIFLGIEPEKIAENLADNSNNSKIDNIVEIKTADITEIKTEIETQNTNETKSTDIAIVDTVNQYNIVDTTDLIAKKITTETTIDKTEDNTTNIDNTITENDTKQTSITDEITDNSIKTNTKFSVYPVSVYTDANPIPINPELPKGIIFKVQVGAFKNKVRNDVFNGLSPLAAEKIQGSAYTRYLVGQFSTYEGGKLALNEVKTLGYKDAFVVAYKDGKRIPLYLAKAEAKKSLSNYNDLASQETTEIKNRNKNALSSTEINNVNSNTTNITNNNTIVKANNIKAKNNLLYTVQIGVYRKAVSHSRLYNLSPIYEDVTQYGYIRYTTGIFNNIATANAEKDRIRKIGIKDAFVTAYYKGKRITVTEANKLKAEKIVTEETKSIQLPQIKTENNQNATNNIDISKIRYKIQIGAYKNQVPLNEVKSFLTVARTKNLEQFIDDRGYTIFAIGNYNNYQEAANMKTILINEGITDAFIVAYNGNVKISVTKAKELLGK